MHLIDIGVNLAHRRFDKDRDAVVARARAVGVGTMVLTGTSVRESARVLELAEEYDLVATVGVHPHDARHVDEAALASLESLARHPRCVAIGECGLDFDRDFSPRPDQERAFTAQLELAAALGKPLFLHQRAAWGRFEALLRAVMGRVPGAVVHCFTDGPEVAEAALALGCHVGVTGWICDDRRAAALRAAVPRVPGGRLMLETDAPFLSPRDLAGDSPVPGIGLGRLKKRNEPALLPWICRAVARFRGEDPAALAAACTATTRRFFGLDGP
ncbi:MAG: hydrolase TatD [Deltaproteobacteria bacterium]|nr:MAG: hydrolase TatD [Deltaproteobacteria bacterium]